MIIGKTRKIVALAEKIAQFGKINSPVLVVGEAGSGKDTVVTALYDCQNEFTKFEKIDAERFLLPEFQQYIFGNNGIPGLLEKNDTFLFVDNLDLLPVKIQLKILDIIEYNEMSPIDSIEKISIKSRLVFSSSVSPGSMEGLRFDLLNRLSLLTLSIPPLRERKEDIILLADYFLNKFNLKYEKKLVFNQEFYSFLVHYDYPGNVRELENLIESIVIVSSKKTIDYADLPEWIWEMGKSAKVDLPVMSIRESEKNLIQKVLNLHNGNRNKAASVLEISERNLYRKIREYDLNS